MATGPRIVPNRRAVRLLARESGTRRLLEAVAGNAADNARRLAPRNTGALADSIDTSVDLGRDGWTANVFFRQWYGLLWELGHKGRSKPFLRPGTQAALSKARGRFTTTK